MYVCMYVHTYLGRLNYGPARLFSRQQTYPKTSHLMSRPFMLLSTATDGGTTGWWHEQENSRDLGRSESPLGYEYGRPAGQPVGAAFCAGPEK